MFGSLNIRHGLAEQLREAIWSGQVNIGDVPLDLIDEDLERGYAASMWQPGGDDGS
jgi:hypothetical protein